MKLWVNADDFGISKSATDAIFECFKIGLITTTTMCSNGKCFDYAVSLIKETQYRDCVGVHINLTEGTPLTSEIKKCKKICDDNGNFKDYPKRYAHLSKKEKYYIYLEIKAQFEKIEKEGLKINHIDSHHHIHNSFRILPIVKRIAREKEIHYIRICRNTGQISLLKRIYKFFINKKLKKYSYSDFMGGIDDLNCFDKKKQNYIFEVMVHPDFELSGRLIDRDNDDYTNPTGNILNYDKNSVINLHNE